MTAPLRISLSDDDIQKALAELDGWTYDGGLIERTFEFSSFREAISFIVRLAFEAESMDHHPELTNVYSRVRVALRTHDAGNTVTDTDIELARRINHISWI